MSILSNESNRISHYMDDVTLKQIRIGFRFKVFSQKRPKKILPIFVKHKEK